MISEISVFPVEGSMIWQISSSSLAEFTVGATMDAAAAGGTSAGAAGDGQCRNGRDGMCRDGMCSRSRLVLTGNGRPVHY